MSAWLERALARRHAAPLVPLVPIARADGPIGTDSTISTSRAALSKVAAIACGTGSLAATPPRSLDDVGERAAILEHDAGLTRPEADDQAAREAGFADAAAYRAQLMRYWRHGLTRLHGADASIAGRRCTAAALSFIADGWAEKALGLGWGEQELLWADEAAPWVRFDRLGAAYFGAGIRVACITADTVTFCSLDGARTVLQRHRGDGRGNAPWLRLRK